jgi:LuxR family transcriptional regulator, maltose regulon positive regulatory protein
MLRVRLLEQLNKPHDLTFILAPAGYGKTTLLSTWLETCQVPYAWLSLDEHDNDLAMFVTGLVEALHGALPPVADKTLTALTGMTLPSPEALSHSLLDDLAAIEQDFILVLDDYHVIHNQAIHELMQELVNHPPRAMHLVIASRHDPPLPLARLRVLSHVVELRTDDLRLTLEETAVFLREVMALPVDEQTIALLAAKTEGWPVGLRLAALALRRPSAPGRSAADAFAGNRYAMDYLLAEVLSQLPISVQDFLIKTSFLDQLSGPLCAAVTGMADHMLSGEPILDWMDHADLFVVPMDEQRHWYRCHHLFRQLLLQRLADLQGPAEIAALQLRASTWFAANGYLDEALHHALASGDAAAAVPIVAQHRHELMNQGQWQRLERWLHLFPREAVNAQPDLLLIEIWLKFIRQQLSEVAPFLDQVEALLPGLPPEPAARLQGEVEARRSALLFWSGEMARGHSVGLQALEKIPADWWYIRGFTRLFVGATAQASGDLAQAYAVLYTTGESNQPRGYHNLLIGLACFIHWAAADLAGMAQAARQVLAASDPYDPAEIVTFSQYHAGLYHYQRNDLAAAEGYLLPLTLQPYRSHALCFLNSAVLLARLRQAQAQSAEAREIVDVMLSVALETHSNVALFVARAFQAELALRQGRLAEASQWAAQYGPSRLGPLPLVFAPPVALAQILLAQDTPDSRQQARLLLEQMGDFYTAIHQTVIQIQVLALRAMLCYAEGDEQQALELFEKSIALGEPGGFLRLYVDLGPQLKPLLHKLAQRGVSPAYLGAISAAYGEADSQPLAAAPFEQSAPEILRSASSGPIEPLTNREQDVLLLLEKRYTDKEIANTLSISVGTVNTHVRHVGDKLGARGRRAIVQAAKDRGLLV